jgi:hypothetical protein
MPRYVLMVGGEPKLKPAGNVIETELMGPAVAVVKPIM